MIRIPLAVPIVMLALISSTTAADRAPSLDAVLERYLDALGGRAALESLQERTMRVRVVDDMPSRRPPVFEVDTLEIVVEPGTAPADGLLIFDWWTDPRGPLHLDAVFPGLEYEGMRLLDGRAMHVARAGSGRELLFDAETGLLVRLGVHTTLGGYRDVDGVLTPHRMAESRKGGETRFEILEVSHGGMD